MYYTSYNDILVFSSWWKTKICIISIFLVKSPLWMSHFTLKIWRIIAENLQQILEIFSSVSELNRKFESSNKLSFYIRRKSTKWIKLSCRGDVTKSIAMLFSLRVDEMMTSQIEEDVEGVNLLFTLSDVWRILWSGLFINFPHHYYVIGISFVEPVAWFYNRKWDDSSYHQLPLNH